MGLLSMRNVSLRFGGIVALDDVSLEVEEGTIAGLIGPNGAGKTTAFNVITRLYRLDSGDVVFDGHSLLRTPAERRDPPRDRAHVPERRALPDDVRARERPRRRAHARSRFKSERATQQNALDDLDFVGIADVANRPATGLPFGTLKRVELARALASRPRLLLLDEPAGGLNHEEVDELGDFIKRLRDELKLTVLLVEHHMNLVMNVSDHVHVLNFGRTIASGPPRRSSATRR